MSYSICPSNAEQGTSGDTVYVEYVVKGSFIEGLSESTDYGMHPNFGLKTTATRYDLTIHISSLTTVQHGLGNVDAIVTTICWIPDLEI